MTPTEYRVIISPSAFAQLDAILSYIGRSSPQNAAGVVDRIMRDISGLRHFPQKYAVARGARSADPDVRCMPVPPFLVDYRIDEAVLVVRVLGVIHGAARP